MVTLPVGSVLAGSIHAEILQLAARVYSGGPGPAKVPESAAKLHGWSIPARPVWVV